jgi:hypothetical protein
MTLSLAIVTIILVAVQSLIVLAVRSIDSGTSLTARASSARWAADQVVADLRLATTMATTSPTAVTFSVPDRAGGAGTNTIAYSWSGAGANLTRSINGGAAAALATNVQNFNLTLLSKSVSLPVAAMPAVPSTAAETTMLSYDTTSSSPGTSSAVRSTNWYAEYFKPAFTGSPISWNLTHLRLYLKRNGTITGTMTVAIQPVDASNHPISPVLDSYSLNVTTLATTATLVDIPFTQLTALDPAKGYAVVLTSNASTAPAFVTYDTAASAANMLLSNDTTGSTGSWNNVAQGEIDLYIFGTITTP